MDAQGRHISAEDEKNYHLALWNGELQGCLRVQFGQQSARPFTEYRVYDLVRRMPADLAKMYHTAIETFVALYRNQGCETGETGGWAISKSFQRNPATLALPLAGWSFSRIFTRQIRIAAATERNGSSNMLKRMGGWPLKLKDQELPPFFDYGYQCQMELLCFDSDILNPRFESVVRESQMLLEDQCAVLPGTSAKRGN